MNIAMRTKIKKMREVKGFTQKEMAEKLNMDERNYKRIESGEKKTIDIDLLSRIAEAFEADVVDLLTNEVNIEKIGDNHDNNGAIGYNQEVNVTNNSAFPPELKQLYDELLQQMRDVISEKNKTIEEKNQTIELLRRMQQGA